MDKGFARKFHETISSRHFFQELLRQAKSKPAVKAMPAMPVKKTAEEKAEKASAERPLGPMFSMHVACRQAALRSLIVKRPNHLRLRQPAMPAMPVKKTAEENAEKASAERPLGPML